MSRELKFRAWDGTRMRFNVPVYNGKMAFLNVDEADFECRNWPLMQYTGLQDRRGKEIWIGDILVLDLISGDRFSEVVMCEQREVPAVRFFPEDEGPYDSWEPLFLYVGKPDTCLAVCGNIYENPELLEVDHA